MPSSEEYLTYILDQLSGLDDITYRCMMGEYLLYYRGILFGGIYDNRLLIKPAAAAADMVPHPRYEKPYEGAKEMLMIEDTDDKDFLIRFIPAVCAGLPHPKSRK